MRYTLIKGTFSIIGTQPDGDTIALLNSDGQPIDRADYNKRQGSQAGWTIVF